MLPTPPSRRAPAQSNAKNLSVCLVVPYDIAPQAGGVKQHALHLMAGLRALGDTVTLIGPSSAPGTQMEPGVQGFAGVVHIRGNGSDNAMGLWTSPRRLAKFFADHPADVIHMHEPEVPLLPYWSSWLQRRVAQVVTFHAFAEHVPAHVRGFRRFAGSLLYGRVQRAMAVSPGAARLAQAGWRKPLQLVPNGVDHRLFTPRHEVSASHGGPLRLLFVGGLSDDRKGIAYLLEAFGALLAAGANVELDLVGAQGTYGPLPQHRGLRHHQNVATSELAALYRQADVLVAPATGQESFGIILLEAMASGIPIVATHIEGYRHVLDATGTPGAIRVPPRDSGAIVAAVQRLIAQGPAARAALGAANRAAIGPFTWDAVTLQVRAIYREAIAQKAAGR